MESCRESYSKKNWSAVLNKGEGKIKIYYGNKKIVLHRGFFRIKRYNKYKMLSTISGTIGS